jgi:hypothetical protein
VNRLVPPLCLLLVGCQCGPAAETDGPVDSADSTDTHDSAPPAPVALSLELIQPEDTLPATEPTVGLVHVRFGDGPAMGETLASVRFTDGQAGTLELPAAAPVEHLASLGNLYLPVSGSLYMLAAFLDDGDGQFQEGETLLSVAMDRFVMWYELDLSPDDSGADVPVKTWRVVDLGIEGQYAPNRCALDTSWPLEWMMDAGYPVYHELDEPIRLTMRGLEAELSLHATIVDLPAEPPRLAALPYPHVGERAVQAGFDLALVKAQPEVSAALSAVPPAEDDVGSDPDWAYTMHLLLSYVDSDGSGDWTTDDALEGSSTCLDGELAWARYTRPVDSYRGYRFLDCYGGTVGWRLVHYAEDGGVEYFDNAQAAGLVLDFTDCRLD